MEAEDIPAELVAIVDARAHKVHSRDGVVLSTLAKILTAYDRMKELDAARVAGKVGDALGGLDQASLDAGRLTGRVETLLWCQRELQLRLARMLEADRFADPRPLEDFLGAVRDSLTAVQDGSGNPAGFVSSPLGDVDTGKVESGPVPSA
jgi:hypothetical protein